MSEPLPSGWHSAPSEARPTFDSSTLVRSRPPPSLPLPSPRVVAALFLVLSLFTFFSLTPRFAGFLYSHVSVSSTLSRFFRLPLSLSYRAAAVAAAASPVLRAPQQEQTSTTGSSRGHEVTVDGSSRGAVSRSPGIIARPPWGFNRPEVRHQRDTCSTLTILLALFLFPFFALMDF